MKHPKLELKGKIVMRHLSKEIVRLKVIAVAHTYRQAGIKFDDGSILVMTPHESFGMASIEYVDDQLLLLLGVISEKQVREYNKYLRDEEDRKRKVAQEKRRLNREEKKALKEKKEYATFIELKKKFEPQGE